MRKRLTFVVLALVVAGAAAAAGSLETPYEGELGNGMRVILIPNPSMPMFASTVVVDAGVVYEPPELSGVTHMLEHMLFNGTEKRTQKQLYDEVDLLGAYNNAFTRETYTGYLFVVPKEGMAESLDIQSDMLLHSTLPPEKLEKEKGIVIEEIGKDKQSPMNTVNDAFRQILFQGTPLERPVLGTVESVKSFTRDAVLRYYQNRYRPGSMTLLCMGDFDKDQVLSLAEKTFGAAPKGGAGAAAPVVKINWPRVPQLNSKKVAGRTAFLQMAFPAPPSTSEDFLPFIVLARLLDSGYKTGLKDRLSPPGGGMPRVLRASVSYAYHPDHPYLEVFLMMPGIVDAEALSRDVGNAVADLAVTPPDPEEVKTALIGLKAEDYSLEEKLYMYGIAKAELLADAPKELFLEQTAMLRKVRPADIQQAARRYLSPTTFVAVALGPGYPDGVSKEMPLQKEQPAAQGTEEKKTAPRQAKVERIVLSNGMTAVLAESPGSRIFAVHLLAKNRSAAEPQGKAGIADLLHRLLEKGAPDMDEAQLTQKLAEMGATLQVTDNPFIPFDDYYFTGEYSYIRFETLGDFAEAGLGLLAHLVQSPPIREDLIAAAREEMLGTVRRDKAKPSAVAGRLFLEKLLPGNPLRNPLLGTEESLQGITVDDLNSFHRIYFAPTNLILSIVGNAPMEDMKRWAETYFGKIPDARAARTALAPAPMPKPVSPPGEKAEEAVGKEQSSILIGSLLQWKPEDLPALTAMNEILSERLAFDLREKQGLAYSIGSALHIAGGGQTPWGWLSASMGTSPANVEKSTAGILQEMGSLGSAAPDEMELRKAVAEYVGKMLRRRLPSVGYAYTLGLEELQGMPPGCQMQLLDAMKRLKPEDVRKAAKKYIHTDAMVESIAK